MMTRSYSVPDKRGYNFRVSMPWSFFILKNFLDFLIRILYIIEYVKKRSVVGKKLAELEEKVKAYIKKYDMISKEDKVILGLSGGPDSVCLLLLLKELEVDVHAVHVNHGIRGKEADADEAFVKELCKREDIPFSGYHVDVPAYAKEVGLSCEEAGREVRREIFQKEMDKVHATKIALAHHMNDNAETLLFNLSRGTGIKGMAGIRPIRGEYIRPILCLTRKEIEEWLEEKGESYCVDCTNEEDVYTRNRIRNHMIPYMEENVNAKVVEHLSNLSEQILQLEAFVERQTTMLYEKAVKKERGAFLLDIETLKAADPAIRSALIKRVLGEAAGKEKDIESVHLKTVEDLADRQSGKKLNLPYGLEAVRRYGNIWIEKAQKDVKKEAFSKVEMRTFDCEGMPDTFPESPYTKWFDYDIIKNNVVIRGRKTGDYITIDRNGNKQKLKKYFANAKIPQNQRDEVMLVADGDHIMWVVGYRQNQHYQVTEQTKHILEIKIIGGERNGRTG